jgi:hypothetical protein
VTIGGLGREQVRQGIAAAVGGFDMRGDTRQFNVQNYHLSEKRCNVSSTVAMPPAGREDPLGCLACTDPHSIATSLRDGEPIVIILSDQSFSPVLPPVGNGKCVVVMRVEDCELKELEDLLFDRFKAFCKPYGQLPAGSVIMLGSLSHLAKNGLNYYAPILVETMTRIAGRAGQGVSVIPYLPVPVGGGWVAVTNKGHVGPG